MPGEISEERIKAIRAALDMPALSRRRIEAMIRAVEATAPIDERQAAEAAANGRSSPPRQDGADEV